MIRKLTQGVIERLRYYWLVATPRVYCEGRVIVKGNPIIDVRQGARVDIGDAVTLNSDNRNYHLALFTQTKLLARNTGAHIAIGAGTRVHGSCIHATKSIEIGKNCLIAGNCQIFDCSGHSIYDIDQMRETTIETTKPICIGDNVWLGTACIVLPGSSIGRGSVVSAGSVVRGIFPEYSLISGNPAVLVKSLAEGTPAKLSMLHWP